MTALDSITEDLSIAVEEVLRRSIIDPDFRDLALADGSQAIRYVSPMLQDAGLKFTEDMNQCNDGRSILLPTPIWAEFDLSDLQLEEFAGATCTLSGCMCTSCCCSTCCTSGTHS